MKVCCEGGSPMEGRENFQLVGRETPHPPSRENPTVYNSKVCTRGTYCLFLTGISNLLLIFYTKLMCFFIIFIKTEPWLNLFANIHSICKVLPKSVQKLKCFS